MKCIDDEIPFEIPNSWEWCRVCAILIISSARRVHEKDWRTFGVPFYRAREIGKLADNGYVDNDLFIEKSLYDDFSKSGIPRVGDLMMTAVGTLGKTYVVTNESPFYYKDGSVLCIGNPYRLNSFYLKYFFESSTFSNQYVVESDGTTVATLTMVRLNKYFIPIPPLSEQQRIVDKIEELKPYITRYSISQQELNALNDVINDMLKKSILQEAIQGRLVPQIAEEGTAKELLEQIQQEKIQLVKEGKLKKSVLQNSFIFKGDDNKYYESNGEEITCIDDEIPFEIPSTWRWCRIRDIFQINPKNTANDDCLAAFIPMGKIQASYKSEYSYKQVYWGTIKNGFTHFAEGDVAFAKITPCFQNRKSAIFQGLPNGIGAGSTELKVLRQYGENINRWYLLFFLESPYFIEEAKFKGTANQQRIVSGYLETKLFPLPPFDEQSRIVSKIEELMKQLSSSISL